MRIKCSTYPRQDSPYYYIRCLLPTGDYYRVSSESSDSDEAKLIAKQLEKDLTKKFGTLASQLLKDITAPKAKNGLCLRELFDHYLTEKQGQSSYNVTKINCNTLMQHLGKTKPVESLTRQDIAEYKTKRRKKVKKQTVNRELGILQAAINLGIVAGLIENEHICQDLLLSKQFYTGREVPPRDVVPSEEDLRLLIKNSPHYLAQLIFALSRLGYRRSELLSLKFRNIDYKQQLINISGQDVFEGTRTKNLRSKTTPLFPTEYRFFTLLRKQAEKVFGNNDISEKFVFRGRNKVSQITNNALYRDIHLVQKRLGWYQNGVYRYRLHDLRRWAIPYLKIVYMLSENEIMTNFTGHLDRKVFDGYNLVGDSTLRVIKSRIRNLPV